MPIRDGTVICQSGSRVCVLFDDGWNERRNIGEFVGFPAGAVVGATAEAAVGAVCKILECLRYSLMYKDITGTSHVTKEFLTGARQKAGYAHNYFQAHCLLGIRIHNNHNKQRTACKRSP